MPSSTRFGLHFVLTYYSQAVYQWCAICITYTHYFDSYILTELICFLRKWHVTM